MTPLPSLRTPPAPGAAGAPALGGMGCGAPAGSERWRKSPPRNSSARCACSRSRNPSPRFPSAIAGAAAGKRIADDRESQHSSRLDNNRADGSHATRET